MKATNLNVFYQLGYQLGYLTNNCRTGQEIGELCLYAIFPREWLAAFIEETKPMARYLPDSRACAQKMLNSLNEIMSQPRLLSGIPVTQDECSSLLMGKDEFEKLFEQERKNLSVFTVTPKGTYDTRIIIESPQDDFPDRLIPVLPAQFIYDLKQAGRCLAFDVPTACAFHVCRGTEALMLAYYELLAGHPWAFKKRDWKIYIEQLIIVNAPVKITNRLEEIRALDRNTYIHPEINIFPEEAKVLFGLCAGVNYYMAEEMSKLTL